MKYTYFDYLKILAILRQFGEDIKEKSAGYCSISITTFQEKDNKRCFDAFDNLFIPGYFNEPRSFGLIRASLCLDAKPLFTFVMGEEKCEITGSYNLSEKDIEIFKEVLPFHSESDNWQSLIGFFIRQARIIRDKNLMLVETILSKSIKDFDFTVRAYNAVMAAEIKTFGDLTNYPLRNFSERDDKGRKIFRNVGDTTITELKKLIEEKGFTANVN
jgi:hypothetical protein